MSGSVGKPADFLACVLAETLARSFWTPLFNMEHGTWQLRVQLKDHDGAGELKEPVASLASSLQTLECEGRSLHWLSGQPVTSC